MAVPSPIFPERWHPRDLRANLRLSRERMARLLNVSSKTIERWEAQVNPPTPTSAAQRLALLDEIVQLGLIVFTPDGFVQFVRTPLPAFDNRTALGLVESGQGEQVLRVLATLYEGLGA
jgi:DNA-binding XRE family transcriptional regulator